MLAGGVQLREPAEAFAVVGVRRRRCGAGRISSEETTAPLARNNIQAMRSQSPLLLHLLGYWGDEVGWRLEELSQHGVKKHRASCCSRMCGGGVFEAVLHSMMAKKYLYYGRVCRLYSCKTSSSGS